MPRVASNVPVMVIIWEQIVMLNHEANPFQVRSDAAQSFVSIARYDDRVAKTIIEEGGVEPLLKFIQEAPMKGQESAARAIGLLACDRESVEYMIRAVMCEVFVKILREGPMKVQAVVAWALSVLVNQDPKCQGNFAQHDVVPLLVSHLAFETDSNANEDPETKANIKAMAAIALWKLGRGTPFAVASQNQKHCYLSQCFFVPKMFNITLPWR